MAYEREMQQLARDLTTRYGELQEARCLPDRKIELIYPTAVLPLPTNHIMQFGYSGTGPKCFHTFLTASGLHVSMADIEKAQAPHAFRRLPNPERRE